MYSSYTETQEQIDCRKARILAGTYPYPASLKGEAIMSVQSPAENKQDKIDLIVAICEALLVAGETEAVEDIYAAMCFYLAEAGGEVKDPNAEELRARGALVWAEWVEMRQAERAAAEL